MSASGPALEVSQAGLATVAASMASAAGSLAALAAVPPVHASLAPDEVSTSTAARLSEHGGVLSSRAADGAAVLAAAAQAVLAVSTTMSEIDMANAAALALRGQSAVPVAGRVTPAAVKANAAAADSPITPMAPRPGELTARLIELGSSSTGTTFQTVCRTYEGAFEDCALAARSAQNAVAAGITGRTGPRLSAALNRFASWADSMAAHCATLAKSARDHGARFERTQHDTPRTQQFTDTRRSLVRAQMLNMQTGGRAFGLVAKYSADLQHLDSTATAAGVSYHLDELPKAPPPPPPVTDIVDDGGPTAPTDGSGQPGERKPDQSGENSRSTPSTGQSGWSGSDLDGSTGAPGIDSGPPTDTTTDPLLAGDTGGSAMGGDPIQQIAPIAAMLPSALAGALGGAMGAVTSVPQQIGQQVIGAAQQFMQGAAASLAKPEDLGLDTALDDIGLSDLGGGGVGGSGGGSGGGGVEPAAVDTTLPASSGGALAAASAPPGGPVLPAGSGAVSPPAHTAPASAGMGGMMMPPMMGGMGAGGAANAGRAPSPPDKTVVIASIPNGEPVKGEVERRQTASVEDPAAGKAAPTSPGRPRRVVTPDPEGDAKK